MNNIFKNNKLSFIYNNSIEIILYNTLRESPLLPTPHNTDPSRISVTIRDIKKSYIHEMLVI